MSTIQRLDLGYTFYVANEVILKPISSINTILKCADDDHFIVPENTDVCMLEEFYNIMKCAEINRMHLNLAKTKEI